MAVESSRSVAASSFVAVLAIVNFILQGCIIVGSPNGGFMEDNLEDDGFVEKRVQHGSASRHYQLYVPSAATAQNPPQGLVLFLHGLSVSVGNTCNGQHQFSFDVVAEANAKNYIAVCAAGLGTSGIDNGWNNDICCGAPVGKADDVGFIRALLDDVRDNVLPTEHKLEYPKRNVFAFGFSTGGLFSYRLACELSDRINGIAPIGATWSWAFGTPGNMPWADNCAAGVPVYESIGSNDKYTTADLAETKWREYSTQKLSCDEASATTFQPVGGSINCHAYSNCGGSTAAKSQLCIYEDMPHTVRSTKVDFGFGHTGQAWDFLVAATA